MLLLPLFLLHAGPRGRTFQPQRPVGVCLTRSVISVPVLAACLERYWNLSDVLVTEHHGGMGSATWFVGHRGERWVAKLVAPVAGIQFAGGLALAQRLDQAGIPSGAPLPAGDGRLAVDVGAGWLALLRWVPGDPLTGGTTAERELIGTTLARVHEVLAGCDAGGAQHFHWVDPDAGYLSLRPWLRPAVVAALEAFEAADPGGMTWGLLHADPAPDAFRLDQVSGRCGVIDWSYFLYGPLLYDLASAVMYVGGPSAGKDLIEAYLRRGTLTAAQVRAGMVAMLRFRGRSGELLRVADRGERRDRDQRTCREREAPGRRAPRALGMVGWNAWLT